MIDATNYLIDYREVLKRAIDKAELNILIDNPNEYPITELEFDYLNIKP